MTTTNDRATEEQQIEASPQRIAAVRRKHLKRVEARVKEQAKASTKAAV